MSNATDTLKPCPMPGCHAPSRVYGDNDGGTFVGCADGHYGPHANRSDQAIAAWNERPIEDALRARLAEAEAERDAVCDLLREAVNYGVHGDIYARAADALNRINGFITPNAEPTP